MRVLSVFLRDRRYGAVICTALCCIAWMGEAQAAVYDATITFTNPTTRVGGAPLTAADFICPTGGCPAGVTPGVRVKFPCIGTTGGTQQGVTKPATSPQTWTALFPADGTYPVCLSWVDNGGRESANSAVMTKTVSTTIPPPANPVPGTLSGLTFVCPAGTTPTVVGQTTTCAP